MIRSSERMRRGGNLIGHTLTKAPMTPRLVNRRYSYGRVLLVVLRNGYRKSGMCAALISPESIRHNCNASRGLFTQWQSSARETRCAWPAQSGKSDRNKRHDVPFKNRLLVSEWLATHCSNARALHTRFEACAVKEGGESAG